MNSLENQYNNTNKLFLESKKMSKISEYLSKKHNKDIKIFVVTFNFTHTNKIKTLKSLVKIAKSEHRFDIANRVNNFLEKVKV